MSSEDGRVPIEFVRLQIQGVEDSQTATSKSLNYIWHKDQPDEVINVREGYDLERMPLSRSPPLNSRLSLNLASYLRGVGVRPSQEEAAVLNGLQESHQNDIEKLEMERAQKLQAIRTLSQELVTLEDTVQEKVQQLAVASSVLAPIRRLPLELLTRIFHLTFPEEGALPLRKHEPPLLLCQICSLWREIMMKDPTLWSRVFFSFPDVDSYRYGDTDESGVDHVQDAAFTQMCHRRMEILQCLVDRSGSALVELSVQDYLDGRLSDPTPAFQECRRDMSRAIRPLFPRCRELEFMTDIQLKDSLFSPVAPGVFSELEDLKLRLYDEGAVGEQVVTNSFSQSPLRHYLLETYAPKDMALVNIPYNSLKMLTLVITDHSDISCAEGVQYFHDLFKECSSVRVAHVEFDVFLKQEPGLDANNLRDSGTPCASLGQLSKLSLRTNLKTSASTMLRGFSFPNIKFLSLQSTLRPLFLVPRTHEGFINTVMRDMPYVALLTTLVLTRVYIGDEDLRSLLCVTTRLEVFGILKGSYKDTPRQADDWLENSSDLIQFLTIDEDESAAENFLPALLELRKLGLCYGLHTLDERHPYSTYATLARSRYHWRQPRSGLRDQHSADTDDKIAFKSSPFQIFINVERKNDNSHFATVKAKFQEEIGPLHAEVLRMDDYHSLAYLHGEWIFGEKSIW